MAFCHSCEWSSFLILRKRKEKKGGNYSDEYDDEEADSFWEDSDYERKVHENKVTPGNESAETDQGAKKAKRPDGISEKEWRRMTRE